MSYEPLTQDRPSPSFLALGLDKNPSCRVPGYIILVYEAGAGKTDCVMPEEGGLESDILRDVCRCLSPTSSLSLKQAHKAICPFDFGNGTQGPLSMLSKQ